MDLSEKRICVIGAGPGGMAMVNHWNEVKSDEKNQNCLPDLVCYERQDSWGGQWKFNWSTGSDIYGNLVHGSMHQMLFVNSPKELLEFHDYSWDEHFGKPVPSYVPRDVVLKYFEAYWMKKDLKKFVKFNHSIIDVAYDKERDNFKVLVRDEESKRSSLETFDYVVSASGIWSCPNMPQFKGIESFPGEVVHTHNIRSFQRFKDKDLLIIGSSFSAEDAAAQSAKSKCGKIVLSSRSLPMGYLGDLAEEKGLVETINGKVVTFKDGSKYEPDSIILATGYQQSFPYLKENPTESGLVPVYPSNAYKGVLSLTEGNNKLFHMLLMNHFFIIWTSRLQAKLALKIILGEINLPTQEEMKLDVENWKKKFKELIVPVPRKFDLFPAITQFMLDYKFDLAETVGSNDDVPIDLLWMKEFIDHHLDFDTLRENTFASVVTGTRSVKPKISFNESFYETDEEFRKLYVD